MRRLLPALFVLLAFAVPSLAQAPGFGFADKGPIRLDVATIEVVEEYRPPLKDPNVEHLIPVTPTAAVKLWAQDRLKAVGSQGTARLVIRDASVVEQPLERTEGVRGWFTKDQTERYSGKISVELVVQQPAKGFNGAATAAASRSTTVREDVSLAEREKVMLELVRQLATDLDGQLDATIRANLFPVLVL
ncbi:hypothetical protein HHL28_17865 [Aerophototrophica crusticola]|uniref:Uncharacterized protein n=1 Tax=Aerophototrophica crusticola TaxID=1709002 RepID=A0A858RBE8_9PROT|nr:hypothetical protein HHL28_17865 [Rhodospirillaceae bacterium B3]